MSLKNQITEDMKSAMKAGDKDRRKVVRLMMAALKQVEVDSRSELDDNGVLGVLEKMVKQRRDSIEQFEKGAREDLEGVARVLDGRDPERGEAELVSENKRKRGSDPSAISLAKV